MERGQIRNRIAPRSTKLMVIIVTVVISVQLFGQELPIRIHPKFDDVEIRDIEFIDENRGFLIGAHSAYASNDGGLNWSSLDFSTGGVVAKSNDDMIGILSQFALSLSVNGGDFWNVVYSSELSLMDFSIDTENSIYLMNEGSILISQNQGLDWSPVQGPPTFGWWRICFLNPNVGFVSNFQGSIYRTENGGQSWSLVYDDWSAETLNEIKFISDQVGFAVGEWGHILKTTNQGVTWTECAISTSDDFYAIDFFDEETIVAVGEDGKVAISDDGGDNWSQTSLPMSWGELRGVSVKNDQEAYAIGSDGQLFHTTNRGVTWTELTCDFGAIRDIDVGEDKIHIISNNYTGSIYLDGQCDQVYSIANSWNYDTRVIEMLDEDLGYRIADNRNLRRTEDGGETWSLVYYTTVGSCTEASDIVYKDGVLYLIADCSPGFFVSNDLGYSWSASEEVVESRNIFALNEETIYLYGPEPFSSSNRIHKSTDGGMTWEILSEFPSFLYSLYFVNEEVGYCGVGNTLRKTTDGGESWTVISQPSPSWPNVSDLFFADENNGWILGGSYIYHTQNGGLSWEVMPAGPSILSTLEYSEADGHLYAAGVNNHVFKLDISSYVLDTESFYDPNNKKIHVYPNPISDAFTVSLPSRMDVEEYHLYSTDGRLLLNSRVERPCNVCEFEVPEEIKSGIYLLRVISEGQSFTKRIILNR